MTLDNHMVHPGAPGDYEMQEIDCVTQAVRISKPSVPSISFTKNDRGLGAPKKRGPGTYGVAEKDNPFDQRRTNRLGAERKLLQKMMSRSQPNFRAEASPQQKHFNETQ